MVITTSQSLLYGGAVYILFVLCSVSYMRCSLYAKFSFPHCSHFSSIGESSGPALWAFLLAEPQLWAS